MTTFAGPGSSSGPGATAPPPGARELTSLEPTPLEAAVRVDGNVEGNIVHGNTGIVVNTNYGTIVQVQAATITRRRRPSASASPPPRHFVGRAGELQRLSTNATRGGITVSGSRGVGRSTLLRRLAAEARTPPWETVIELRATTAEGASRSVDDLAQRIHDAAYECVPDAKVDASTARAELAGIAALVLIEDVGLWGRDLERLAGLVPDGVVLMEVGATAADSSLLDLTLGPLPRSEAVSLLLGVSELVDGAGDTGSAAENLDIATISELLADWPEALVVAGNAIRTRRLHPKAAISELRAAETQAADLAGAGLERAWALAQPALDLNARRVLIAAAVLPGATHDPNVLRLTLGAPDWFDDALASLAALGLLVRNSPRLRMPDGLRALVASDASGSDLATVLADRQLEVVTNAERERILDPDRDPDEIDELLGAFGHAVGAGRHELAVKLGKALSPRLVLYGLWDAWRYTARGVRSAAEQVGRDADVAWAAHELGTRALVVGDRAEGVELLTEALRIRRRLGDTNGAAYTLHNLGRLRPPPPWWTGDGLRRLLLGGGLLAVALVLLGAVGPAIAGVIFPPAPSASPQPSVVAQASVSPSASAPPSESVAPSMSPSLPPLPDLVVEHDFDAYQFDGQDWTTTITITLTGGQGDYVVVLDGLGERHENPSSFPLSGTGCVPYTVTGTATAEGAEATQITIPAVPDPCPTEPPVFVTACVTFDDIPVGTIYGEPVGNKPGDQVYTSDDGIAVFVRDFLYSTEGGAFNSAEILAPNADGGGTPSVWFNNINLEFDFSGLPYEPRQVDFEFNDYGGNQNLSVNGSDIYRELLMEAPSPIGGVSWTWADPEGDGIAIGTLDGAVQRFLVGGQELALDTVCAHPG